METPAAAEAPKRRIITCGQCGGTGHNRRTCTSSDTTHRMAPVSVRWPSFALRRSSPESAARSLFLLWPLPSRDRDGGMVQRRPVSLES